MMVYLTVSFRMSREQPQFAVVDQAIGTMRQIKEYINVGMETTIDVAMDVVENDRGFYFIFYVI